MTNLTNAATEAFARAAETVAARIPIATVNISGNTIGNWLADNVVFVLVVIVGIVILTAAITKKPRDAAISAGICFLALGVIAAGVYHREIGAWFYATFLS